MHIPASGIDLTVLNLPSFTLPVAKTISIPEIIVTSVEEKIQVPDAFSLSQNFPNPFNPEARVEFTISEDGIYTLSLFNLLGEKISDVTKQFFSKGAHRQNITM